MNMTMRRITCLFLVLLIAALVGCPPTPPKELPKSDDKKIDVLPVTPVETP